MNLEKILLKINQYGAMLILTAPLWVYNGFIFPYIHLKNIFFRVLILGLMITLTWYWLERRQKNNRRNYIFYSLLVFLSVQVLAAIFGFNPVNSFWGSWERMDGVINLVLIILYFVLLSVVMQTKRNWLNLIRTSLAVAVGVALFGLIRNGLSVSNNQWSTLGNSAFLGFYMLLNLGIAGIAWIMDERRKWRWAYLGAGMFLLLVMLGAASRAPILGLLIGLIVGGLFYLPQANKKFKLFFLGVLAVVALTSILVVWQKDSALVGRIHFLDRLAHISKSDSTTNNRLLIWQSGWQAFKQRPLLGWGPENFFYGANKYYNPQISEDWFDRAHNFVIDYLVSSGIVGLLTYLTVWLTALWVIWRKRRENYALASVLVGLLAAYLFSSLFIFDTLNSWLVVMLILALISWLARLQKEEVETEQAADGWQKFYYLILGLVVLLVVLSVYVAAYKPARANYLAGRAYQYSQADPDKSLELYNKSLALNTFGQRETVLQMGRYALLAIRAPEANLAVKNKVFAAAEEKLLDYLEKDPNNLQVRMMLAQVYLAYSGLNTFYINEAIDLLKNNISDSPRRVEMYFMIAQAYYLQQDLNKTIEYLEMAYQAAPQSKQVYENLMNFYSHSGLKNKFIERSREYLKRFEPLSAEEYRKLGEYYFRLDMYHAAENILTEKAIPAEPNNWRSYVSLASLYVQQGQTEKARQFLQQAVKEHPNFEEVVGKYLETIK